MNRLLLLNSTLVESVTASTIQPAVPVVPAKKRLPVQAKIAWEKSDSKLKKTFKFNDVEERNSFLYQLLAYEQEKGHNATMLIKEREVTLQVTTKDLGKLTELDREYAHAADQIYEETKDAAERRTSSLDE